MLVMRRLVLLMLHKSKLMMKSQSLKLKSCAPNQINIISSFSTYVRLRRHYVLKICWGDEVAQLVEDRHGGLVAKASAS